MILTYQPRATSALVRALEPDANHWGLAEQLLASIYDVAQYEFWRNTDSKHRGQPPKPYPRPGVAEPKKVRVPSTPTTVTDMDKWLQERRASGKL